MTLACLANQSCTEFVPAQTQLVFYFDKKKEETIAFMQTNSAYLEFKISVSTEEITEFARSYQRNPFYLFLLDFSRLKKNRLMYSKLVHCFNSLYIFSWS